MHLGRIRTGLVSFGFHEGFAFAEVFPGSGISTAVNCVSSQNSRACGILPKPKSFSCIFLTPHVPSNMQPERAHLSPFCCHRPGPSHRHPPSSLSKPTAIPLSDSSAPTHASPTSSSPHNCLGDRELAHVPLHPPQLLFSDSLSNLK